MRKILLDWDAAKQLLVIDDDGLMQHFSQENQAALGPINGLACQLPGNVVQLFVKEGALHFSSNGREFDVSVPGVRALYISALGQEWLLLRYSFRPLCFVRRSITSAFWRAISDATYDRLDFDADRFLLACARLINNKQQQNDCARQWNSIQ